MLHAVVLRSSVAHARILSLEAREALAQPGVVAFAEADLIVEERIDCGRHAAIPLEPRGLVAELDDATGELTVFGAARIVHVNRRILARLLGWPEQRIRLVELHVGGGFGARG